MNIIENELELREGERATYSNNISLIVEGHVIYDGTGVDTLDFDSFNNEELEAYNFWNKQQLLAAIKKIFC